MICNFLSFFFFWFSFCFAEGSTIIPLCVVPHYIEPAPVKPYVAAVLNSEFQKYIKTQWDLTTLRVRLMRPISTIYPTIYKMSFFFLPDIATHKWIQSHRSYCCHCRCGFRIGTRLHQTLDFAWRRNYGAGIPVQ